MTGTATITLTNVYVHDATIGQTVTIDGVTYKVTEINLATPNHPVLTTV